MDVLKKQKYREIGFGNLLAKLQETVGAMSSDRTELNLLNIVQVTTYLMQVVERYPRLTGPERKQILLDVLEEYIDSNLSQEQAEELAPILGFVLPSVIDALISVDSKERVIQTKRCVASCFSCF